MRTRKNYLRVVLIAVLATIVSAPIAAANTSKEKDLGSFGAWRAYAYDEGGQSVCYMVTTKTLKATGPKKRAPPYLMITHRPVEASTDVFSYGAGALLDAKHGVKIEFGKNVFDLFSVRDTAWARDSITDHKLAAAIRNAVYAQVSSISSQNRVSTIKDIFDLNGAHAAYHAISKACGLPDVESKKSEAKKVATKKTVAKKPAARKITTKAPVISKTAPTQPKGPD